MLKIVEVLGVSWGTADLIQQYLSGEASWTLLVDAGLLVAGIITGGTAALVKEAVKIGLKEAIKGLGHKAAIAL